MGMLYEYCYEDREVISGVSEIKKEIKKETVYYYYEVEDTNEVMVLVEEKSKD